MVQPARFSAVLSVRRRRRGRAVARSIQMAQSRAPRQSMVTRVIDMVRLNTVRLGILMVAASRSTAGTSRETRAMADIPAAMAMRKKDKRITPQAEATRLTLSVASTAVRLKNLVADLAAVMTVADGRSPVVMEVPVVAMVADVVRSLAGTVAAVENTEVANDRNQAMAVADTVVAVVAMAVASARSRATVAAVMAVVVAMAARKTATAAVVRRVAMAARRTDTAGVKMTFMAEPVVMVVAMNAEMTATAEVVAVATVVMKSTPAGVSTRRRRRTAAAAEAATRVIAPTAMMRRSAVEVVTAAATAEARPAATVSPEVTTPEATEARPAAMEEVPVAMAAQEVIVSLEAMGDLEVVTVTIAMAREGTERLAKVHS